MGVQESVSYSRLTWLGYPVPYPLFVPGRGPKVACRRTPLLLLLLLTSSGVCGVCLRGGGGGVPPGGGGRMGRAKAACFPPIEPVDGLGLCLL